MPLLTDHRPRRVRRGAGRRQAGFTLVELLVVIAILGILAAIVVFAIRGLGDRGKASARAADATTLRTAEEAYCAKNGRYASESELEDGQLLTDASSIHQIGLGSGGRCGTGDKSSFVIALTDPEPALDSAIPVTTPDDSSNVAIVVDETTNTTWILNTPQGLTAVDGDSGTASQVPTPELPAQQTQPDALAIDDDPAHDHIFVGGPASVRVPTGTACACNKVFVYGADGSFDRTIDLEGLMPHGRGVRSMMMDQFNDKLYVLVAPPIDENTDLATKMVVVDTASLTSTPTVLQQPGGFSFGNSAFAGQSDSAAAGDLGATRDPVTNRLYFGFDASTNLGGSGGNAAVDVRVGLTAVDGASSIIHDRIVFPGGPNQPADGIPPNAAQRMYGLVIASHPHKLVVNGMQFAPSGTQRESYWFLDPEGEVAGGESFPFIAKHLGVPGARADNGSASSLAIDRDTNLVFGAYGSQVKVFDAVANTLVATIDLPDPSQGDAGGGVFVDDATGKVFVPDITGAVNVIDGDSPSLDVTTISPPDGYSDEGGSAWAFNARTRRLYLLGGDAVSVTQL